MRLLLILLTAALILLAIRWLAPDGQAVLGSAASPRELTRDHGDAVSLAASEVLERAASLPRSRQPVGDRALDSAGWAAEFALRHRGHGPRQIFRNWSGLQIQVSTGLHEIGLRLFRQGLGVLHRGPHTAPNEQLAAYWCDEQNRRVRVEIPEEGNQRLYALHREARWLESQLDSFRWTAAEMQELSKTVFEPAVEGAQVRREFLDALRASKGPKPKIIAGPWGAEIQSVEPSNEYQDRVRAAGEAYLAARAETLRGAASGPQE